MKASSKLFIRRSRENIGSLLGIFSIITLATTLFITLFSIGIKYEESSNHLIADYNLADYTQVGNFDLALPGTEARLVFDYYENEIFMRVITITDQYNTLYLNAGKLPQKSDEIAILYRNSKATSYNIGSKITIDNKEYTVTALVSSPEYIYLYKNDLENFVNADQMLVIYKIDEQIGYNQLLTNDKDLLEGEIIETSSSASMEFLRDDIEQIKLFAKLFSPMFIALVLIVIAAMITRSARKDYKLIGIIKSLGHSDSTVIMYYLFQFIVVIILGVIAGGIISYPLTNFLIELFTMMFYVPTLQYEFYWYLYLVILAITIIFTTVIGVAVLRSILKLSPAQMFRPISKSKGSNSKITKLFFWNYLSFNTRYTIRNVLRTKSIYVSSVLAIVGALSLLFLSLGFINSISSTVDKITDSYGDNILIPAQFLNEEEVPFKIDSYINEFEVKINDDYYQVSIVGEDDTIFEKYQSALESGIIITEYYNESLNLKPGEKLVIDNISYNVAKIVDESLVRIYGTDEQFMQEGEIIAVTKYDTYTIELLDTNNIPYTTSKEQVKFLSDAVGSLTGLVYLLIVCSIMLLITTIGAIGFINISYREYEYMFMGVLGNSRSKVLLSMLKETVLQLVVAIPLGLFLGSQLLNICIDMFSNELIYISKIIYPSSYIIAILLVVLCCLLVVLAGERYINRLDIVESLKAQDD